MDDEWEDILRRIDHLRERAKSLAREMGDLPAGENILREVEQLEEIAKKLDDLA